MAAQVALKRQQAAEDAIAMSIRCISPSTGQLPPGPVFLTKKGSNQNNNSQQQEVVNRNVETDEDDDEDGIDEDEDDEEDIDEEADENEVDEDETESTSGSDSGERKNNKLFDFYSYTKMTQIYGKQFFLLSRE